MGGALNGNIGVMRTMVSEIVQEKKYEYPDSNLKFVLTCVIKQISVESLSLVPDVLQYWNNHWTRSWRTVSRSCGELSKYIRKCQIPEEVSLCATQPSKCILPRFCILRSVLWSSRGKCCSILVERLPFDISQTLESIRHKEDLGTKCSRKIAEIFRGRQSSEYTHSYTAVPGEEQRHDSLEEDVEMSPVTTKSRRKAIPRWRHKLPFRRLFTYNVICTLIAHSILATHLGTFNNLWFVFLSTPVADPAHPDPPSFHRRLPFIFTGGLGMPPRDVGFAMATLGVIGILMQLFIYPVVNNKLGVVKSWRIFLYCFPLAYALVPFLAIVPSKSPPPAEKDGILVWLALCSVLFIQVTGRTFALPATTILVNNASPHPSVLGTMHGVGQSLSSAGRTIGPSLGGSLYGLSLRHGVVGAVFWGLGGLAVLNCIASNWVREGDGHEIKLEGDEEAEAEFQAGLTGASHSRR